MWDAVIVGSGCTGGWAAKELTEHGLEVLVLEAGPPFEGPLHPETWSPEMRFRGGIREARRRQPVQSTHASYHRFSHGLFVDDLDHPYSTPVDAPFRWIRSRRAGGRSLLWMGITLRLSDFELASHWPLSHATLDPYYREVERFLGVRGHCDGLPQLPDGDFSLPSELTPAELELAERVQRRWPKRRVINARGIPVRTAPAAERPHFTSVGSTLARAEATGRLTMRCHAFVTRVTRSGVEIIDTQTRRTETIPARNILLCGATIETCRLLLGSSLVASERLGSGLMDHPYVRVNGSLAGGSAKSIGPDELGGPNGFFIPRFRNLEPGETDFQGGYGIWGRAQRGQPREDGRLSVTLIATCEMLPRVENRVKLDANLRDVLGLPSPHVEVRFSDNEHRMAADAEQFMRSIIELMDGHVESVWRSEPGQGIHEVGGARMGTEPTTSVTDPFGRIWGAENVLVLDGAAWPSCGYQNPTLTMMALTVRACRELVRS